MLTLQQNVYKDKHDMMVFSLPTTDGPTTNGTSLPNGPTTDGTTKQDEDDSENEEESGKTMSELLDQARENKLRQLDDAERKNEAFQEKEETELMRESFLGGRSHSALASTPKQHHILFDPS